MEIRKVPHEEWDVTKVDHLIKAKYIYTWRPPSQLACQLPDGFALSFGCWVDESGFRRFHPIKPCGEFVFEASLAGHAIRSDRGKTEREPNFSQHEARPFNQFSRFTRDYLGKTVKLGQNLGISQAGQPDAGTKDILPDVGLTSDPQGELVGARRAGDRQCKKVSAHKNQNNRPASHQPLFEDLQACDAEAPGDLFREIALRAAHARGDRCDFAGADWDARLESENATSVVLRITCPARDFDKAPRIPRKEFERIALEVKAEA